MSAPVSTEYPTPPIPYSDDDLNSPHHDFGDDGDDFVVEDGDDDDDLGLDETNDDQVPPPRYSLYQGVAMCVVCHQRPAFSKGGKSYPTCGLNCAQILASGQAPPPSSGRGSQGGRARGNHNPNLSQLASHLSGRRAGGAPPGYDQATPGAPSSTQQHHFLEAQPQHRPRPPPAAAVQKCVVCLVKPCHDRKYVTCSLTCAEKLCKEGSGSTMCDYCHRRPKLAGHQQCGETCRDRAKIACLLCKSRPKFGRYHLCGKFCKELATKSTPLLLEAPPGHQTYELVEKKFNSSWTVSSPSIKGIYKIIENKSFLTPYDKYKQKIGNEVFRYHGTRRTCTLGSPGNTQLCSQKGCALCSILRTSFKVSLARSSGGFGAGVYTSSAPSKSFAYAGGTGAIILCKVVLGKIRTVSAWGEVKSCPGGFNSVEYGPGSTGNETIVYSDDAIRPVFLIVL